MPDRNLFGKWQDLVAGPVNQPSNIDLLRALFQSRQPQVPPYMPPMNNIQAPERGKYVNMLELSGVPMPNGQARPPIPQEFLNMPTDTAVEAYRNQLYPQSNAQSAIEPQMDTQRNQTLQTPQVPAQQPTDNTNRNNMLMAALFGGVAPALAAAFGGQTGLAAGSGFAQGFGGQYARQKELQQQMAMKPWQPQTREEQIAFEKEKLGIKAESPQEVAKRGRADLLDSTRIRQEFENRPEVKEYVTTLTQVKGMEELLRTSRGKKDKNLTAVDQALITMYNKMTDPNSVVRESEYERTPQNLPLFHRIEGAMIKVQQGGAGLTDSDREAILEGAKILSDARGQTYNQTLGSYEDLADEYGIKKELVSRGFKKHDNYFGDKVQKVKMTSPDGTTWELDQSEVEEAKKHGWK